MKIKNKMKFFTNLFPFFTFDKLDKAFDSNSIKINLSSLNLSTEKNTKNINNNKNIKTTTEEILNKSKNEELSKMNFCDFFKDLIGKKFWENNSELLKDYNIRSMNDLNDSIQREVPNNLRVKLWQSVSKFKNLYLEDFYEQLKSEKSVHENSILRDLKRTNFYSIVEKINKTEQLFNVMRAYSIFDPDVGYTQGMIFIAIPLIINMKENDCFCLLVTLMKSYNLRELFCPEMKGLHFLFYEFDRLLENRSPNLYNHLIKQGINSSMYTSQWFLTFFAYKLPLKIVLRVFDSVIFYGLESLLKFSLNLMIKNKTKLLSLHFEDLLSFLKNDLFDVYHINKSKFSFISKINSISDSSLKEFTKNSSISFKDLDYDKVSLFNDSFKITILPEELFFYKKEFAVLMKKNDTLQTEIKLLESQNFFLTNKVSELNALYLTLNNYRLNILETLVQMKYHLFDLIQENNALFLKLSKLTSYSKNLKSNINNSYINVNDLVNKCLSSAK